ncbi:hypothetical protein OWR29_24000 [Actinoplanes sp. Pm04-4]|uniref:Secreted protein n=1 Tax=Paractinoplanes pyxinae TaxID=2997416 RepID=A0ABT4B641_9ACTN|nr:hypothetical protein [Actinoplanes pyxinae]MCY1141073.1 hypothetical protein [Actinoplanes pyxinae]
MTGATLGAGPAMASTSAPDNSVRAATTTADQPRRDRDWVEGYYDSRRDCERDGRRGEWRDRWDDYDCDMVRRGPHRGDWELTVSKSWDWHDRDHHGGRGDRDRGGDDD